VFHVRAVDALDVFLIENVLHGLDGRERIFYFVEKGSVEDARALCCFVSVVFEDIPAAKDQVIQPGQGHEIFEARTTAIRTLSEANGRELGDRADRLSET